MVRRKKSQDDATEPTVKEAQPAPGANETPEITRFVWHASDLIKKYDQISGQIETLEKQIQEANRISRAGAERIGSLARNGVKVEITGDFERERKKIGWLIDDRIGRAERLQWMFWAYCAGAGAAGAVFGSLAVMTALVLS